MANTTKNFAAFMASMQRMFKSGAMSDLTDSLDIDTNGPMDTGMWGRADNGNCAFRTPTSPQEAASGRGASEMISRYSDPQEGNGITEGYALMARELQAMGQRMEKSELAIKSIADLITRAITGKAFPADESEEDDSDKDSDDSDDDDETAKSAAVVDLGGIENLMKTLGNASRQTGRSGLARPPTMTGAVRKAVRSQIDVLSDIAENATTPEGSIAAATKRMRLQMAEIHGVDFVELMRNAWTARHHGARPAPDVCW